MITEERFNRVLRMLEERAEYHQKEKNYGVMTAYNSAIIMLIEAEKGHDDLLDQFDYYHKEK